MSSRKRSHRCNEPGIHIYMGRNLNHRFRVVPYKADTEKAKIDTGVNRVHEEKLPE